MTRTLIFDTRKHLHSHIEAYLPDHGPAYKIYVFTSLQKTRQTWTTWQHPLGTPVVDADAKQLDDVQPHDWIVLHDLQGRSRYTPTIEDRVQHHPRVILAFSSVLINFTLQSELDQLIGNDLHELIIGPLNTNNINTLLKYTTVQRTGIMDMVLQHDAPIKCFLESGVLVTLDNPNSPLEPNQDTNTSTVLDADMVDEVILPAHHAPQAPRVPTTPRVPPPAPHVPPHVHESKEPAIDAQTRWTLPHQHTTTPTAITLRVRGRHALDDLERILQQPLFSHLFVDLQREETDTEVVFIIQDKAWTATVFLTIVNVLVPELKRIYGEYTSIDVAVRM